MELRQLRYFVSVAEEKNISRAAQKIFLTQPALSRQIRMLENDIGQCLFDRQAHSIRLTPAGETLFHEARELLSHAERVLERVRAAGQSERLRVGYAPSLASGLLSRAVESFAQKYPNTRVQLFDLSTKELLAGLEDESLDVALMVEREQNSRMLKWTPLARSPWQLAVNRGHRFARRAQVSPADIARERLLVFCQRDYPEYWDLVTGWLRRQQQPPVIAGEYDGISSLMAAVESGLGVALVTTSASRLIPERVTLKTLAEAPDPVCIAAAHLASRDKEKPLSGFIEELREATLTFV